MVDDVQRVSKDEISLFFHLMGHKMPMHETKNGSRGRRKTRKGDAAVGKGMDGSESDWGQWDTPSLLSWSPGHFLWKEEFLCLCGPVRRALAALIQNGYPQVLGLAFGKRKLEPY